MAMKLPVRNRQKGAVAIMVGLAIFILIGFLGLVVDLGQLYVAKTELQNAADAAALGGAKELNGTAAGVTSAVGQAVTLFGLQNFNATNFLVTPVTISIDNIMVGSCPDDSCMVAASTVTDNAQAADKFFIKVDTSSRALGTFVMGVAGFSTTATFGLAVAGPFVTQTTPIGVCCIDIGLKDSAECGFRRGVAYNLPDLNPLASGDPIWIDPVATSAATCNNAHGSTTFLSPFICQGKSQLVIFPNKKVFTNTGVQAVIEKRLNSRFDNPQAFTGGNACDPATAPPDANVKSYKFDDAVLSGSPREWMEPDPIHQTLLNPLNPAPPGGPFDKYGVLWSFTREFNFGTGTNFDVSDWGTLYGGAAVGYPTTPSPIPSPYANGLAGGVGNKYFAPPPDHPPGKAGRRILNIIIIDCSAFVGGQCKELSAIAIGKFFMQVPADFGGSPKKIEAEFAGYTSEGTSPAVIKLFR